MVAGNQMETEKEKNSHGLQGRKIQDLKIWRQSRSEQAEKGGPGQR